MKTASILILFVTLGLNACQSPRDSASLNKNNEVNQRLPVLIDTDANNELDDQHALAYLFLNEDIFDIKGVTVNATFNGGAIDEHMAEAKRVMQLMDAEDDYPLIKGANASFESILPTVSEENYDGKKAVDFIIQQARAIKEKLILIPVGKLTNIALALEVAPDIKGKVRIVWLGSNYPQKGEYNQINDTTALNYILNQEVPFEIVTVRYGDPSGTDAVRVSPADVEAKLQGKGPQITTPVIGRHGGSFSNFGDYSVSLFSHIDLHGDPPSRALFDMVAIAILKNPDWGTAKEIPAPILINDEWINRPHNDRMITLWENFDKQSILEDFYLSFQP